MKAVAKDDGVTPVTNAAGSRAGEDATPAGRTGERVAHPATPISTDSTASSGIANARIMAFIMPRQTPQMTRIDQDRVVAAATGPPDGRLPAGRPGAFGGLGYAKVGSRSPVIFAFG
jgi:hypothetical protein